MFPASDRCAIFAAGLLLAGLWVAPTHGQEEEPPPPPESTLEDWLEERGLRNLLIDHLLRRIRIAEGEDRAALAERLGSLYVDMLERATTTGQRREWEARAHQLLQSVPEAESVELRLNLAKARYLQAEDIAEQHRIRLASPEERAEAEAILRSVGTNLTNIATSLHRRIEVLERRESLGRDEETAAIRSQLADARRLRSLAMYYAGWSAYYSGLLTKRTSFADDAINHFGWLLNASGKPANVESVAPNMLRYEHVARSAIGCALAESLRGRDGAALLWLHTLDSAEDLPPAVRKQLLTRRFIILAEARRWGDLDLALRRRRTPQRDGPTTPLEPHEARLVAVLALEALQDPAVPPAAHDAVRAIADTGITDLITLGEARLVHDLVSRYGSGLLAGEGFIVQYVRGLHAYERAREAHAQEASDQEPSTNPATANLYSAAAQSLENAAASADADRFPGERASAAMLTALCAYYSNRLEEAADRFEQAYTLAAGDREGGGGEDALWMAIVALDKAVESGRPSLKPRRERLATLYLREFPSGDRAAMLLLRMSAEGLVAPERAAEILLAVDRSSTVYSAARRHAADLLYGMYRRASGADRDFAALRFAEISDELLLQDIAQLNPETADGRAAADRAIVRLRQVLDAVLGMSAPDLQRAERALQQVQTLIQRSGADLGAVEAELTFRRFQVALLRSNQQELDSTIARLHEGGGRFADAADRLLYQRAVAAFRRRATPQLAADVVRHGQRVISQFGQGPAALADPAVQSLYNTVAEAAAMLAHGSAGDEHRRLALRLDRALVEHGSAPASVLQRFASLAEADGDTEAALDAWRRLMAGLGSGSGEWFEARYHSLRLLVETEPARAREALEQFKVLYPAMGGDLWAARFLLLEEKLSRTTPKEPAGPDGGPAR